MIDFNKFTSNTKAIVPILNGRFQYNRKKYIVESSINGWYFVSLNGNVAQVIEECFIDSENIKLNKIKGYTYNNNIIFNNFDVGKRKIGKDIMSKFHFNNMETFSSIEVVLWEDNNLYFYGPNYADTKIYEIKEIYDSKESLDNKKGVTPELKTLFLFHVLEKSALEEEIRRAEQQKAEEEFKNTLQGRLILSFNRAGGRLLRYSITNNRIIVDWTLEATGRTFNSVIDKDSFKVIEAGYCMSGDDTNHNLTSMVILADEYEKDDLIYITRHT